MMTVCLAIIMKCFLRDTKMTAYGIRVHIHTHTHMAQLMAIGTNT